MLQNRLKHNYLLETIVFSPAISLAAFEEGMKNVESKRKQTTRMAFISRFDTWYAKFLYPNHIYRPSK